MSRAEDWNTNGGRDRWGEHGAGDHPGGEPPAYVPPQRSAVVTTAGVLTMVIGVLMLLSGVCSVAGLLMGAAFDRGGGFGGGPEYAIVLVGLLVCFITLVWGGMAVAGGIGLLNRRPWARVLTLILAGVLFFIALLAVILSFVFMFVADGFPERGVKVLLFLLYFSLGWFSLLYCVWVFFVLLHSRYSQEFRTQP